MQIHAIKLPLVELKNINVKYGQQVALNNINLTIYPNSIITIVGPNGGGKSTLLKVLLKLQQPTSGKVIYNKHIRIGYVPQKIHLDHNLPITVEKFLSLKKGIYQQDIQEAMTLLSITHLMHNSMQKLSGGEMQRICLIRSLIFEPKVLLLDEVTSALDAVNTAIVEQVIDELHNNGMTIIAITHSEEQSLRKANRRITIVDGSLAKEEVLR